MVLHPRVLLETLNLILLCVDYKPNGYLVLSYRCYGR